jgi:hypothetical protein
MQSAQGVQEPGQYDFADCPDSGPLLTKTKFDYLISRPKDGDCRPAAHIVTHVR